jgi:hypothetical protein
MNSEKYDVIILDRAQVFIDAHTEKGYIWMQDNASCHRSKATQRNLRERGIIYIPWPRYSPDLNLIKHVWNWIKNYIQQRYYKAYYNTAKVPLDRLKEIIKEAWLVVPESYIETLFESWWRRCQAVIDTRGAQQSTELKGEGGEGRRCSFIIQI